MDFICVQSVQCVPMAYLCGFSDFSMRAQSVPKRAGGFILLSNKNLKHLLRKIPHNCVVVLGIFSQQKGAAQKLV